MTAFQKIADVYDLIYHDKDYAGESRFLAQLIEETAAKKPALLSVLDLGCGTGRHLFELAKLGFRMEGSDLSKEMIEVARDRAKKQGVDVVFHVESFQTCSRIGKKFDVVMSNFSAIDYLTDAKDFSLALRNIASLMNPGGIFLFDFWNGNAVLKDFSPVRVRKVFKDGKGVVRTSKTELDRIRQIATVNFDFMLFEGDRLVKQVGEVHPMRYFFPAEMKDLLSAHGFTVMKSCPFLEAGREISADDWNLSYVTRLSQ